MSMVKFCITVPEAVVLSIDEVRGLIPRSTWIANELKKLAPSKPKNETKIKSENESSERRGITYGKEGDSSGK